VNLKKTQQINTIFEWNEGTAKVTVRKGIGAEKTATRDEVPIEKAEEVWDELLKELL
jgi:hypothetical protein